MVYIREAHPTDGWQVASNERDAVLIANHRELKERSEVALSCAATLGLTAPVLIDGMDNAADLAYGGWPERLYVIGTDGRIAYQGEKGPYGFDPDELERFLEQNFT